MLLGYSHFSLSVRDRDRSAAFYAGVFGFEPLERITDERFDEIVLVHPATGMVLCLRDPDEFQLELFYTDDHP